MTPEKLEALRVLAADERTPIDEARNAALQFVRHGGKQAPQTITIADVKRLADVSMVREAFGPELDALKREESSKRARMQETINSLEAERDQTKRERDAYKKQMEDVRAHGKAILAFIQGEPERMEKPKQAPAWEPSIFYNTPRVVKL